MTRRSSPTRNYTHDQRAENGGLDLAFLGGPDFQSRGPQIPIFKGFWDLWTQNRGAPKTPNPTTTDPTPHLRPSEMIVLETQQRGDVVRGVLRQRACAVSYLIKSCPTFFCASFLFLPCPPHPSPRQFSSPESCLSGTSDLLFFCLRKGNLQGLGFGDASGWGRPTPQEKRKSFFFLAREKR